MRRLLICAIALVMGLQAHHSMSAVYDDKASVTIRGAVSKFDWANPHVWVFVDAPDGNWAVEFSSRLELRQFRWTAESLHIGDEVTITGDRARDLSRKMHGRSVVRLDGSRLTEALYTLTIFSGDDVPAPRWPDGRVRLGNVPGRYGYWALSSRPSLYEESAGNIPMNPEGLLRNIADAPKVAPFQPWALALYKHRQETLLKDDPMEACLPPGGPRQFQAPYGFQLLEDKERQRVFVLSMGGNRNWRIIDLDGRALPKGEDVTPTYYGYSVGRWEKDSLIVDTVGLVERFWFSNGGLPHTESAKLREQFTRESAGVLRYQVTIDDPGAYTRPWTASFDLQWITGDPYDEYFCDDYNRETLKK
jgi:hypothetical protein